MPKLASNTVSSTTPTTSANAQIETIMKTTKPVVNKKTTAKPAAKKPAVANKKPAAAPITKPTEENKRGRRSLADTLTKPELQKEIAELMAELGKATDAEEKKRIRRALRRRGHRGGLTEKKLINADTAAPASNRSK